jgi:acyl dehydratase
MDGVGMDYSKLLPGQQVSNQTYTLDADAVSRYIEAVGDSSGPHVDSEGRPLAPAMAVAALSFRGLIKDLEIPGGTLHVGQELEFARAVQVGERLTCRATLAQNSVRRDVRFMVVHLEVEDSSGQKVMNGKSTITVPG